MHTQHYVISVGIRRCLLVARRPPTIYHCHVTNLPNAMFVITHIGIYHNRCMVCIYIYIYI